MKAANEIKNLTDGETATATTATTSTTTSEAIEKKIKELEQQIQTKEKIDK